MLKKTRDPKTIDRMDEIAKRINEIRFPPGRPADQEIRITLTDGTEIEGKVTGGEIELHKPDLRSGFVKLTDSDKKSHTVDLQDIKSVSPAKSELN